MRILTIILILALYAACATRYSVSRNYSEILEEKITLIANKESTVFFLVDGMSESLLKAEIAQGHLPEIKKHFLAKNNQIFQAHASFPSLTYTNIAGLLSEKPVHLSGAYGNTVFNKNEEVIHFESIFDRLRFAKKIHGKNIFSRLAERQLSSASFDYGLGSDATVSTSLDDFHSGLAATFKDYEYLDEKRLESLENVLLSNKPPAWPHFIFIHLIGVDFLSHQHGPESVIVKEYARRLDKKLAKVLRLLQAGERTGHRIVSMLSSDHGFAKPIKARVDIESIVHSADRRALVFNESRMAGIYTQTSFDKLSTKLLENPKIEIIAFKDKDQLVIQSRSVHVAIQLVPNTLCIPTSLAVAIAGAPAVCPEALDRKSQNLFYPHFLPNLIYYFQAEHHPDVVAIPAPQVSFSSKEIGAHGGPTPAEVSVPLLLRNASLPKNAGIPAIWQLLQFL